PKTVEDAQEALARRDNLRRLSWCDRRDLLSIAVAAHECIAAGSAAHRRERKEPSPHGLEVALRLVREPQHARGIATLERLANGRGRGACVGCRAALKHRRDDERRKREQHCCATISAVKHVSAVAQKGRRYAARDVIRDRTRRVALSANVG